MPVSLVGQLIAGPAAATNVAATAVERVGEPRRRSAADGSLGLVSASSIGKPANTDGVAVKVAVGATFVTCTVTDETAEAHRR